MEYVDTPPIWFVDGAGSFTGLVALPDGCREQPDETVFLLRRVQDGTYIAYGAGRTIR